MKKTNIFLCLGILLFFKVPLFAHPIFSHQKLQSDCTIDALACGLSGSIDERIADCAIKRGPQGAIRWVTGQTSQNQVFYPWRLVTQTPAGHQVWLDDIPEVRSKKKNLWIEQVDYEMSFSFAQWVCQSGFLLSYLKSGLSLQFRLPYYWELKSAAQHGITEIFGGSSAASFWTQSRARDTWREIGGMGNGVQTEKEKSLKNAYFLTVSIVKTESGWDTSWIAKPQSESSSVWCMAPVPQ